MALVIEEKENSKREKKLKIKVMVLSLVWYWYKITCVSGSFRDSSADSRAKVANIGIGIVGE